MPKPKNSKPAPPVDNDDPNEIEFAVAIARVAEVAPRSAIGRCFLKEIALIDDIAQSYRQLEQSGCPKNEYGDYLLS